MRDVWKDQKDDDQRTPILDMEDSDVESVTLEEGGPMFAVEFHSGVTY